MSLTVVKEARSNLFGNRMMSKEVYKFRSIDDLQCEIFRVPEEQMLTSATAMSTAIWTIAAAKLKSSGEKGCRPFQRDAN